MLFFQSDKTCWVIVMILVITASPCAQDQQVFAQTRDQASGTGHNVNAGDRSSVGSFLVLNNGQTMEGRVALEGTKYVVRLPSGSAIRIGKDRVMFAAPTLQHAYWELAARTSPSDLPEQIRVFQWCLRNELFNEAANHLLVLQESDIPARQLASLDSDLETKFKHVRARREQQSQQKRQRESLARIEAEKAKKQQRIETMIGTRTVSIPDLHGSPLRPLRRTKIASDALTPLQQVVAQEPLPSEVSHSEVQRSEGQSSASSVVIDQFGEPVERSAVAQVTYLEDVDATFFSTPAIKQDESQQPDEAGFIPAIKTKAGQVIVPPKVDLRTIDSVDRMLGPKEKSNVQKPNVQTLNEKSPARKMADPFDAEYFNRSFGAGGSNAAE